MMELTTILFPSSYFSVRNVDEDLQKEYDAVNNTGLFDVVLFSYEKWFHDGIIVLDHEVSAPVAAIYRGWMMKPEQYTAFCQQLRQRNIWLLTEPEEYALFHCFPNLYPALLQDTAEMLIFPDGQPVDLDAVRQKFPRFMVKDYVKSVKGTQFPAYFESSVTQEEFDRNMQDFYQFRGSLYTGGICIKEYLDLKRYDSHTNEYRAFYMNHEIATVCRNSGQPNYTSEPPQEILEKYRNLGSPYYTLDYAELESGGWKILEAGDGQVSGLSDGQDYEAYFRRLYHAFR